MLKSQSSFQKVGQAFARDGIRDDTGSWMTFGQNDAHEGNQSIAIEGFVMNTVVIITTTRDGHNKSTPIRIGIQHDSQIGLDSGTRLGGGLHHGFVFGVGNAQGKAAVGFDTEGSLDVGP